jgi:hypothetical protein
MNSNVEDNNTPAIDCRINRELKKGDLKVAFFSSRAALVSDILQLFIRFVECGV